MKPEVDEEGKTLLSVTKQRPLIAAAINKAIENEGEELEKSIGDDALAFWQTPKLKLSVKIWQSSCMKNTTSSFRNKETIRLNVI